MELLKPPETALIKELRRLSTQLQEQQVVDSLFKISPETDSDTESPETGENEHGNSTTKNYSTVSKPNTEKYASSVGSHSELASDKTPEQENDKAAVYKFFGTYFFITIHCFLNSPTVFNALFQAVVQLDVQLCIL